MVKSSPDSKSEDLVSKVKKRIGEKYSGTNFNPIFVYKATWSEVVMFPEDYPTHRNYVSFYLIINAFPDIFTSSWYNLDLSSSPAHSKPSLQLMDATLISSTYTKKMPCCGRRGFEVKTTVWLDTPMALSWIILKFRTTIVPTNDDKTQVENAFC